MNASLMDSFNINPYSLNDDEWVDAVTALLYINNKRKEK